MPEKNNLKPPAQKIKIGSLVFVKTHNALNEFRNFTGYSYPSYPGGLISNPPIQPAYYPPVTTGPTWVGGGTTTSIDLGELEIDAITDNDVTTWSTNTLSDAYRYNDIIKINKFSNEEINSLRELYDCYVNKSSGNGGPEGSMGMAQWHGPPGGKAKKNKRSANTNNSNNTYTIPGISVNVPSTTITAGTSTVSVNFPNQIAVEYAAKGYKNIEDYFAGLVHRIKQEEVFTEEEAEVIKTSGTFVWGKPFKGIVVDVFSPSLKTEAGESVELGVNKLPTMYKVLIGEKDCLWFTAEDVYEMTQED